MAKDILEQITEDYFKAQGYFTLNNYSYRPSHVGVHSDIDVLAIHPLKNEVAVISCKSWQAGINITEILTTLETDPHKVIRGGTFIKRFREIADPIWSSALKDEVHRLTGKNTFTFYLSVAHYKGNKDDFENFHIFKDNLPDCTIKLIIFREMLEYLDDTKTETPSSSDLVRTLQLLKASGGHIDFKKTI